MLFITGNLLFIQILFWCGNDLENIFCLNNLIFTNYRLVEFKNADTSGKMACFRITFHACDNCIYPSLAIVSVVVRKDPSSYCSGNVIWLSLYGKNNVDLFKKKRNRTIIQSRDTTF